MYRGCDTTATQIQGKALCLNIGTSFGGLQYQGTLSSTGVLRRCPALLPPTDIARCTSSPTTWFGKEARRKEAMRTSRANGSGENKRTQVFCFLAQPSSYHLLISTARQASTTFIITFLLAYQHISRQIVFCLHFPPSTIPVL